MDERQRDNWAWGRRQRAGQTPDLGNAAAMMMHIPHIPTLPHAPWERKDGKRGEGRSTSSYLWRVQQLKDTVPCCISSSDFDDSGHAWTFYFGTGGGGALRGTFTIPKSTT